MQSTDKFVRFYQRHIFSLQEKNKRCCFCFRISFTLILDNQEGLSLLTFSFQSSMYRTIPIFYLESSVCHLMAILILRKMAMSYRFDVRFIITNTEEYGVSGKVLPGLRELCCAR